MKKMGEFVFVDKGTDFISYVLYKMRKRQKREERELLIELFFTLDY